MFKSGSFKVLTSTRLAVIGLLSAGCFHYPLNTQLTENMEGKGYRYDNVGTDRPKNTNSLYVVLAFSGGGTRAGALSYGVLKVLRDTPITWEGEKNLLDEVDFISSVSGGSFTSAYYALFGDRLFTDFKTRVLNRPIETILLRQIMYNPINWLRLASPNFSRIDLAAKLYHDTIFEGMTYADLVSQTRTPFININATNIGSEERFEFTQDQFDLLGSNLSQYSVARAVAASSAFPFLLSPISLRNYPTPKGYEFPMQLQTGLLDFKSNKGRYRHAMAQSLLMDNAKYGYVHLMDGGLSDNIGLRSVKYSFEEGFIREGIDTGLIEKLVVIVVNARTAKGDSISTRKYPPGLKAVGMKVATLAMDKYSLETIETMSSRLNRRKQAQKNLDKMQEILDSRQAGDPPLPKLANNIEIYFIEVAFDALPSEARSHYYLSLPTRLQLPENQVDSLINVGKEILENSTVFKDLISTLK